MASVGSSRVFPFSVWKASASWSSVFQVSQALITPHQDRRWLTGLWLISKCFFFCPCSPPPPHGNVREFFSSVYCGNLAALLEVHPTILWVLPWQGALEGLTVRGVCTTILTGCLSFQQFVGYNSGPSTWAQVPGAVSLLILCPGSWQLPVCSCLSGFRNGSWLCDLPSLMNPRGVHWFFGLLNSFTC